jgi:hypothetical protein
MLCQACNNGDHDQCGMQTWCECECEGYDAGAYPEDLDLVDQIQRTLDADSPAGNGSIRK